MRTMLRRAVVIVSAVVCLAPAVAAGRQGHPDPKSTAAKRATAVGAVDTAPGGVRAGSGVTTILGSAWTATNLPLPLPRVRLRNVVTGRIDGSTIGNEGGLFSFESVESGTYVVELVNDAGRTLVVGHMFTIAEGETVATFVR